MLYRCRLALAAVPIVATAQYSHLLWPKQEVPATSGPIERVFSHGGNIMRPDQSRLLPKNFEHLIFLKVNNEA